MGRVLRVVRRDVDAGPAGRVVPAEAVELGAARDLAGAPVIVLGLALPPGEGLATAVGYLDRDAAVNLLGQLGLQINRLWPEGRSRKGGGR